MLSGKTTVTEAEIKEILHRRYDRKNKNAPERKLMKLSFPQNGAVFYGLEGTPSKGYALYIPELAQLSFYDVRGARFRKLQEVKKIEVAS